MIYVYIIIYEIKHIHKYHKSPSTAGPQFPRRSAPPQITGTNAGGGASTTVATTTTTMDENATTTGSDGS